MKKVVFFAAMLLAFVGIKAQTNIQEMYDFKRGHFTTTLEMFKTDAFGSTFFFNDIYHPSKLNGPTGYYTEIARAINFWQTSLPAMPGSSVSSISSTTKNTPTPSPSN